jgi:hypothetical protein
MDLLGKARHLESRIAKALDRASHRVGGTETLQPLEIVHRILQVVEGHVEPSGRGARMFPFNRIRVTLLAVTRHDRARFDAIVKGRVPLHDRIVDRLHATGCDAGDVSVTIGYAAVRTEGWIHPQFHLDFDRVARAAAASHPSGPGLELAVTKGAAEKRTYALRAARIDLGRRAEVRNSRHRLIRTNHVAFADNEDAVNQSVSRCHAHISFDPATSSYRIHDDGSAHGTAILRGGASIDVSRGARGVRILSGDELLLGEARIRVRIAEDLGFRFRTRRVAQ